MRVGNPQTITVAAGQIQARLMNEAPATLEAIGLAIRRAADKRVDLLVLPECAYPAYLLGSITSYRAGEHLRSEEFVAWLAAQARQHRLHLVCGFVEETAQAVFNSAVLLDDRGREVGRARKRFLWNADHDWFTPGDEIRAFDTALGRIGVVICAEARDPELVATLAADGAQLIALPTCWINAARDPGRYYNPQVDFLIEARAREFGIPFVCADKWGLELGATGYVGQSRIVRADGSLAAEAPATGDAVIAARVTIDRPHRIWVSQKRRAALSGGLREAAGAEPSGQSARRITVAAVPTAVATARFTGGMGESLFQPLQEHGVTLALLNLPQEAQAEQVEMVAPAFDVTAVAYPSRADVYDRGSVLVGCIAGQWARSFATARALTLEGAQVLLFFDAPDDLPLLRTRALENRVFVVAAGERSAVIIDPDGQILARSTPDSSAEAVARIDPAAARDKTLAPRTDIFAERRTDLYRY